MRKWQREFNIKRMVCVICDSEILPRTKLLVKPFRGKIVICKECEQLLKDRIEIDEDPIFKLLGGYYLKKR